MFNIKDLDVCEMITRVPVSLCSRAFLRVDILKNLLVSFNVFVYFFERNKKQIKRIVQKSISLSCLK